MGKNRSLFKLGLLLMTIAISIQCEEPSTSEHENVSSLFQAAEQGDSARVIRLIQSGENPNTASPNGMTPLMVATKNNKINTVIALLENGAYVNATDFEGTTALMIASIENADEEITKALLENGADVNKENTYHNTALAYAVTDGSVKTVEILLEHGANPNVTNFEGIPLLELAKVRGDNAIIKLLEREIN